jgi:hypothetical protein
VWCRVSWAHYVLTIMMCVLPNIDTWILRGWLINQIMSFIDGILFSITQK